MSRAGWVAALAAATVVGSSTIAVADTSTFANVDFFTVNGINGDVTVNQGANNISNAQLQLSAANAGGNGPAGSTTRSLNSGNTITFSSPGGTTAGQPAGTTQTFNSGALSYLAPGTYTLNASGSAGWTQSSSFTSSNFGNPTFTDGGSGSTGISVNRTITVLNVAPTITAALQNGNNGNITVPQGSTVALQLQATDPGNDTINFAINGGGAGSVGGGPGSTRTSSTVNQSYYAVGTFNNTFDASDQYGGVAGQVTRQVTVTNVAPSAATLVASSLTINEGQSTNVYMTATDPGSENLTFTIDGNGAGTIAGAPGSTRTSNTLSLGPYSQTGGPSSTYNITGSVSDGNGGNTSAAPLTLTVLNLPPVVTSFGELSRVPVFMGAGDLISFIATATDPGNDSLTYAFDLGAGFGPYTPANSTAAQFFGIGTYTVYVSVSDGDGGFATQSYTFEVVPEPATLALAGLGGAFALAMFRRKRSK